MLGQRSPVLITLMLLITCVASIAQSQAIPDGAEGKSYYVAFPAAISLDGNFADWENIPYQTVNTGPIVPADADRGGSLRFAAAADSDNLYLSIQVTDSHIVANQHGEEYWSEDSVEVYINATGDRNLTTYTPGVAQLTFPAANMGRTINETVIVGINSEQIGAKGIVVATEAGYAIEAAIPLRNAVWNIEPKQDSRVGFQIQLNGASDLDRDMKLSWSINDQQNDDSYQNPSVFGELIFWQISNEQPASASIPPAEFPTPIMDVSASSSQSGFSVVGSTVYDPQGNVFIPKGVNVSGFNWVWSRHTASDVSLIDECWNFNLVRVNSFLFTGRVPYRQYDTNNNLDEIVNTFTDRGIVVVFEGHDHIGGYYNGNDLEALIEWYTGLASRYRDNPYVWFDVMNEPGDRRSIDVDQWVNMHGRVIEAIRHTAQASNVIIVEGAFGGQDNPAESHPVTESAILRHSDGVLNYNGNDFKNIVFSIHTYDLWNQGDEKLANFIDQVHAKGLALIIGEFGIYTDQDTLSAAQSTFNVALPKGVGRIVWHWDGSDANDLTTTGGGWQIDDCQNPTNLSWLGQQIWDDNHTP